tara:strand:- start:393 stop:785 length:393 start_codon:yes stop_codon:yes gene_type:complete
MPTTLLQSKVTAILTSGYVFILILFFITVFDFSILLEYPDTTQLAQYLASDPESFAFLLAEEDIEKILPFSKLHDAKFGENKVLGTLRVAKFITGASVEHKNRVKFQELCLKHYKEWPMAIITNPHSEHL